MYIIKLTEDKVKELSVPDKLQYIWNLRFDADAFEEADFLMKSLINELKTKEETN